MHIYNELEPYAARWLRNLCDRNLIAPGKVDERSIRDLTPDDVAGHGQRHFFAGIGGWSLALRMAGWPDELGVWTGSCPCQPFSVAGKRAGTADDRHLWPDWFKLIDACRPPVIFGEQVASKDALAWLDALYVDLEGAGYTCWAADLCAAGVGAPHIRQRLWWVAIRMADAHGGDAGAKGLQRGGQHRQQPQNGGAGGMADGKLTRLEGHPGHGDAAARWPQPARPVAARGESERLGHAGGERCSGFGLQLFEGQPRLSGAEAGRSSEVVGPGPVNGQWRTADWLYCRDDRWRPVEPGSFPLAHGIPGRVGRLRAYGNAIVPAVAAEFIGAVMDVMRLRHNHPGCPLHGKVGTQVEPDPAVEPPSQNLSGKGVKVRFDGEREAIWVAMDQVEVVR